MPDQQFHNRSISLQTPIDNALAPLSPKEALFELAGQHFLISSGYAMLFEQSKDLDHYFDVRASWLERIEAFNFWTPKLSSASAREQAQVELFLLELRHGDVASAFRRYDFLIQNRKDQPFLDAIADILKSRATPNKRKPSLDFYLLYGWLHGFLWGMDNPHRALALERMYGVAIDSRAGNPIALIKKAVQRLQWLGLKSWSTFGQSYSQAPILARVYHQPGQDPEQDLCEIFFRRGGQM
jgi:hypothetical protein